MSIPAGDEQFKVDRPGWYRQRNGAKVFVSDVQTMPGYVFGAVNGNGRGWRDTGQWYWTIDCDYEYDLIAYLGPLEDDLTPAEAEYDEALTIAALQADLAAARAEIERLKLEKSDLWDQLQKAREYGEGMLKQAVQLKRRLKGEPIGDFIRGNVPASPGATNYTGPHIPMTTRTINHYLSPLLGGEWAR